MTDCHVYVHGFAIHGLKPLTSMHHKSKSHGRHDYRNPAKYPFCSAFDDSNLLLGLSFFYIIASRLNLVIITSINVFIYADGTCDKSLTEECLTLINNKLRAKRATELAETSRPRLLPCSTALGVFTFVPITVCDWT